MPQNHMHHAFVTLTLQPLYLRGKSTSYTLTPRASRLMGKRANCVEANLHDYLRFCLSSIVFREILTTCQIIYPLKGVSMKNSSRMINTFQREGNIVQSKWNFQLQN